MRSDLLPWWLLAACSGDPSDADDTDLPADTDDTGTPFVDDTAVEITEPQALAATLTDPAGAPLVDWSVRFCNFIGCRFDTTDAEGAFGYLNVTLDPHSLEPVPPQGTGFATMMLPYTFDAAEAKTMALVAQPLGPTTPLPAVPTEIELGTGLWVTISTATIEPPELAEPATDAGGVRVPASDWPPVDDVAGTVLAMWHTHPFDHHAPAGLPVRISEDLGLAEGATIDLLVGSYSAFAWVSAGSLTVTGGQLVGTAELPLLSTVIAVQP